MAPAHFIFFFFQPSGLGTDIGIGAIQDAADTAAGTGLVSGVQVGAGSIQDASDAMLSAGTLGTGHVGASAIQQGADVTTGTGKVAIVGTGAIQQQPDTSALPPELDHEDFITYGVPRPEQKKKKASLDQRDIARLRKLREENNKLSAEKKRLETIREQMQAMADDQAMQQMLANEAAKAAQEFGRVAKNYLSLDKRNKMMAMLLALLME